MRILGRAVKKNFSLFKKWINQEYAGKQDYLLLSVELMLGVGHSIGLDLTIRGVRSEDKTNEAHWLKLLHETETSTSTNAIFWQSLLGNLMDLRASIRGGTTPYPASGSEILNEFIRINKILGAA